MNNIILEANPTNNESPRSARRHSGEWRTLRPESAPMPTPSDADSGGMEPVYTAIAADHSQQPRPLRPVRFACGMLLTGCGLAMILLIGIRMIKVGPIGGNISLPLVALGVLTGASLLGSGFGIMAASSSGFDEDEFDRLSEAGNISDSCECVNENYMSARTDEPDLVRQTRRPV